MKPCKECPFKVNSLRGYLGGFEPLETQLAALSESDFDCHLTRERDDCRTPCTGRLLFAKKNFKSFRRKDLEQLSDLAVNENPNYKKEILGRDFISYHAME